LCGERRPPKVAGHHWGFCTRKIRHVEDIMKRGRRIRDLRGERKFWKVGSFGYV